MGNSEVGHLNISAGRVVYQELTRISKEIREGDLFTNPVLVKVVEEAKANDGALHANLILDITHDKSIGFNWFEKFY